MTTNPFSENILLTCEAEVDGEKLGVSLSVVAAVWEDQEAQRHIKASLRNKLVHAILEKWNPAIRIHRN